jgi:hypothetical protein
MSVNTAELAGGVASDGIVRGDVGAPVAAAK